MMRSPYAPLLQPPGNVLQRRQRAPASCRDAVRLVRTATKMAWSARQRRGGARRQALQRRLRILTVPLAVARAPRDLYASADADAILVMLAHKTAVCALLLQAIAVRVPAGAAPVVAHEQGCVPLRPGFD